MLFKPGVGLRSAFLFILLWGLWHCIEWLLARSENKLLRWVYVIIGIIIYLIAWAVLDYYFLHKMMDFVNMQPLDFIQGIFLIGVVATIIIESIHWTKAREKAEIENLRLQAENIEANFQLVKQKINPDFLFHCLTTLQTMVKSNDPKTEDNILKLADVYRQTLKKQKDFVSLKEEIAFLKNYMFLMSYGRETALCYDINVLDASLHYKLPIFSLQSLVDRCIKQNDFSADNPLYIMIFQHDEKSITMSNNQQLKNIAADIDMEYLEMRYEMEGIENGVVIENETATYSTTLKLF